LLKTALRANKLLRPRSNLRDKWRHVGPWALEDNSAVAE